MPTPPNAQLVFDDAAGRMWWREWFWHLRLNDGHHYTKQELEAHYRIVASWDVGLAPLLIDRRHAYSPTFEALRTAGERHAGYFSAVAYLAPTALARMASEVVQATFYRTFPVEIFPDEASAIEWMRGFAGPRRPTGAGAG